MLFINPMWDNEIQRIGKKKCSSFAYYLHVISDLLGFLALISTLAGTGLLFFYEKNIAVTVIFISVSAAVFAKFLYAFSWRAVSKKDFEYDPDKRVASWKEAGVSVIYPDTRDN